MWPMLEKVVVYHLVCDINSLQISGDLWSFRCYLFISWMLHMYMNFVYCVHFLFVCVCVYVCNESKYMLQYQI